MSAAGRPIARHGVRPRLVRALQLVGVSMVLAALGLILAARLYYPRLLYPAPHSDPYAPGEGRLLTLTSRDGVPVHATQFLGPKDAPVLVYFHGNGVAMGDVLWMAREFSQRGLGVVLAEYRGYGLSAASSHASPSETGLYEDAEAVLAALTTKGLGLRASRCLVSRWAQVWRSRWQRVAAAPRSCS